jgi:uroporphyrinogen decarboxylase
LNHRERMENCISGNPVDQIPVALWRHFPVDDQTPEGLAKSTIFFQRTYDFDFIKVSPASSYCLKDWGIEDAWTGNPEGSRQYTRPIIQQPEDWVKLPVLDPLKGHLAKQLSCLQILSKEFSPSTPIIQTIFSPLAQAKNLVGKDKLTAHIREYPEAVHAGLKIITESTKRFLEETAKIGIAGIFYAIQSAQYSLVNLQEFEQFQKIYDQDLLAVAKGFWLNLGHIHGENIMFEEICDYPFHILNWHDQVTKPTLAEGKKLFTGAVCGGLRQWETMVLGSPEQVKLEAKQAIEATNGDRFILGTGCVLPITTPHGNILTATSSATEFLKK